MEKKQAQERILKLKKEIGKYRYQYHVLNRLEISEAALDSLKHELRKIEDKFPEFVTPDSPTQRVAGKPLPGFEKIKHRVRMLSLEDVFLPEEFSDWVGRIQKLVPRERLEFFNELKIDGFAISLIYKNGTLKTGATRGNGLVGENVTQNLKTIEAIPLKLEIHKNLPNKKIEQQVKQAIEKGEIEIRGEVFMPREAFEKVNRQRAKENLSTYANPRNLAAGTVRQLNPKITAARRLDFLAYDLVGDLGQTTHDQGHEICSALGFKTIKETKIAESQNEVFGFWEHIQKIREKLPHNIDGIVVIVNQNRVYERLGVVGKAPRGAIAFKFPAEEATTVVEDIIIQVGRTGTLTPIAVLRPVNIGGVVVKRASLHNMDEIKRLGVKIGDTVIVQRAGDVIPDVVKVLIKLRPKSAKDFKMPLNCPACGTKVIKEGVYFRCKNKNCPALKRNSLYHFTSKASFDVVGLGPKILDQLYDEGLLQDAADIFELKEDDLKPLERFAEKSAQNIVKAIEQSKRISLERLILSLGILHVGAETSRDLAEHFQVLGKIRTASFQELNSISNIGEVVAKSIYNWFNDKVNIRYLNKLLGKGIRIVNPKTSLKPQKLKGIKFVFTGELKSLARDQAEKLVRSHGASPTASISKATDYIVVGEHPGSKYDKAKKLGVKIINEDEFLKLVAK